MSRNLTAEEKKAWIMQNCINKSGYIDLTNLDFGNIDIDVRIGNMKVKGNLIQDHQQVLGDLYQGCQEIQGELFQDCQTVQGNLWQGYQEVKGKIYQGCQEVKG